MCGIKRKLLIFCTAFVQNGIYIFKIEIYRAKTRAKFNSFQDTTVNMILFDLIRKIEKTKTRRTTFKVSLLKMYNLKSLVTDRFGSFVRNKVPIKYFKKRNNSQQKVAIKYLFVSRKRYYYLQYTLTIRIQLDEN